MKKLYISFPMNGLTQEEISKKQDKCFEDACFILKNDDLELIDTISQNITTHTPLECLGNNIYKLASADYVYFSDGWSNARGCLIEHKCSMLYNLNIIRD